ncbi:MAG: class I SAM-dependent methyltransferase [Promethearchaeota archaeon]
MEKKHLDLFWKNIFSLPYFRAFLRAVEGRYYQDVKMLSPILDLGIGDGHFTSETFSASIDVGIDPAFYELMNAKRKQSCELHICGSGDSLPFRSSYFSTVFSNSVLEHIKTLEPVFSEVERILNHDGIFIITVPNDNFTKNLSVGKFLNRLGLKKWAKTYQSFFNKISRHYHPDPVSKWEERLKSSGFKIVKSWNYFPKTSLKILEWGHLFGLPSWFSKKIFGKWILIPTKWNLWIVSVWLKKHYLLDQESPEGAYTFFISKKIDYDART